MRKSAVSDLAKTGESIRRHPDIAALAAALLLLAGGAALAMPGGSSHQSGHDHKQENRIFEGPWRAHAGTIVRDKTIIVPTSSHALRSRVPSQQDSPGERRARANDLPLSDEIARARAASHATGPSRRARRAAAKGRQVLGAAFSAETVPSARSWATI